MMFNIGGYFSKKSGVFYFYLAGSHSIESGVVALRGNSGAAGGIYYNRNLRHKCLGEHGV